MKVLVALALVIIIALLCTITALLWRFERAYTDTPPASTYSDCAPYCGHQGQAGP
jgi:hypothetical protein